MNFQGRRRSITNDVCNWKQSHASQRRSVQHTLFTVRTAIKMPTVVSPVMLILEANVCKNVRHSQTVSCLYQHAAEINATCIVVQLHLLKDRRSAGCFYSYSPSLCSSENVCLFWIALLFKCMTMCCNTVECTRRVSNVRSAAEFWTAGLKVED